MNIIFSKHAEEEILKRKIDKNLVIKIVDNPDKKIKTNDKWTFQSKYVDKIHNKDMLLRVFVKEDIKDLKVITAYKTSKISKYL